jgi:hypothetical protein
MSHIVTIQTEVRDAVALASACVRRGLPTPVRGKATLFSGEVSGWVIQLPTWRFPIVVDTSTGKVHFDNYEGRWGHASVLDRLLQAYACEKAKREARRMGHTCRETILEDGSIRLTIAEGL